MSADLDLRVLHRHHEPDPDFAAALERRLESMLAGEASASDGASRDPDVDAALVGLDSTGPHRTTSRVPLATAAAVVLIAAIGLMLWRAREPGNVATDPDGPTSLATTPTTINVSTLPPPPPPAPPFIGLWASTDMDGSAQTMEIASTQADQYEVVVADDRATACSDAPSTMTGSARVENDGTLIIAQPELTCDDGTTPVIGPPPQLEIANFTFTYDPAGDRLVDSLGVVWGRGGATEDAIGAVASAFLGSWSTSGIGEGSQTMDIAASADGLLLLTIRDDSAAVCAGGASTTAGIGRIATDGELRAFEVVVTAPQLTCDGGDTPLDVSPPIDEQPHDFRLFYDDSSDELGQVVANNVWFWSRGVGEDERAAAITPYQPDSGAAAPVGWVAFVAHAGTSNDVYLVRAGVQPHRLDLPFSETRTETCPAFAPDGERLAFGRARATDESSGARDGYVDAELVVVGIGDDGATSEVELIPLEGLEAVPCPIWAPDGRWVAFVGSGAVWVVDTQTGETRRLPDYDPLDLEWRPGSDELAITGRGEDETDGPIDIYSVSAGTTRTLGDVRAAHLTWSPDGTTLAFRHGKDDPDTGIWLVDADGQNLRKLSDGGSRAVHGVDIVWSPRGDHIAFQRRSGCCEASDVVLVTATDADPAHPIGTQRVIAAPHGEYDWLPFSVTWSADGSHLLYVAWVWDEEDGETQGVVAVPIEGDQPRSVLAIADVSVRDGTPWIPLQQWQPLGVDQSS